MLYLQVVLQVVFASSHTNCIGKSYKLYLQVVLQVVLVSHTSCIGKSYKLYL